MSKFAQYLAEGKSIEALVKKADAWCEWYYNSDGGQGGDPQKDGEMLEQACGLLEKFMNVLDTPTPGLKRD